MNVKWPWAKKPNSVAPEPIIDKHEDVTALRKVVYRWYRDPKIIGLIVLALAITMQIFAFLEVPFFSTIHAYTIGMVMGYYNPFFYLLVIFIGLRLIFGVRLQLPRWFRIRPLEWIVLSLCVLYVAVATGYYQTNESWFHVGTDSWGATTKWFDAFTNNGDVSKWYIPASTNGGALGVVLYSFTSMIISGVGALLLGLFLITIIFSILLTGTIFGGYRYVINKLLKALGRPPLKRKVRAPRYAPTTAAPKARKLTLPALELEKRATPVESNNNSQVPKTPLLGEAVLPVKPVDDEELPFEDPFE